MKKLRHIIAALAAVLFSGSCQQEKLDTRNYNTVTYTVEVPTSEATKTIGEGKNVNQIVYAVYIVEGNDETADKSSLSPNQLVYQKASTIEPNSLNSIIPIELINNQTYVIVFWAQVENKWFNAKTYNFGTEGIKYPTDTYVPNSDDFAAYSGVDYIKANTVSNRKITLKRPFGQLNLATRIPDFSLEINHTTLSVLGAAHTFNVATQTGTIKKDAANNDIPVQFAESAPIKDEDDNFVSFGEYPRYISMNYVFIEGEQATVNVTYGVQTKSHGLVRNTVSNVPIAKNYRTNIIGNLLTSDVSYDITFEKEWKEPAKEVHPLYLAAALGGEYILEDNLDLTGETDPLVVTSNLTLNLNGKNLKGGKVYDTAAGMTGIDIAAISVDNGATLTIEGEGNIEGSSYGVYAKNGTLNIKNGNFTAETSAVQVGAATVNIEGGTFSNTDEDKRYTINCLDANWKDGTSKVNITGGTFIDFNPANNLAEGAGTNFCAEGYTTYKKGNVYVVAPVKLIGPEDDLAKAFSDTDGTAIIKLNSDLEISQRLYLNEGAELHLDLNGKKILSSSDYVFVVWEGGKLIVDGDGTIETETPGPVMFYPEGDLVIESGTFIRHIPEGYTGSTSSMFVGTKPAGGWESTGVTINGGYFDCGYYDANAKGIEEILAGTKSIVEEDEDITSRGKPGDKNLMRVALKNNTKKMFNRSNNYFHIYGGTFVGASPAWGDEGCMLPTSPQYLRPWSYYQGELIPGQKFNENGIVLPDGFKITYSTHDDGRPMYTMTYTDSKN